MRNLVFYAMSTITVVSGQCPIQSSHIHANHKKDKLCYNTFAFVGGKKSLKYQCIKDPTDIRAAQSSGAVRKSRWTSWAPVPNKPTVSVDVKQHFN